MLFHRGDTANSFYFLDRGLIELNLIAATGEKKVLEVVSPGRTFAEAIAFMQEQKYPVTAEALADSSLCQIPIRAYIDLVYANPDACMRLLSDVCRHLHARVREIENLTVQNARSRLTSYLLDHVVETNDDEATVRLELPRHVIASTTVDSAGDPVAPAAQHGRRRRADDRGSRDFRAQPRSAAAVRLAFQRPLPSERKVYCKYVGHAPEPDL